MVHQDHLEEMDHLESLDPLDPQVLRVNTEKLAHRVLKVFLVLLVSLAPRVILDQPEKMVNLEDVDHQAPEVTMAKMVIKELLDHQGLRESKEREEVQDLQETKVSKVFQDLLEILEKLEEVVNPV